ncbi:MAG: hypothetical protein QS748_04630 [Candidatus Endonucleobacter bathymodioli]|uniref:Uncharacterized protein n=1 Tax=Candidatus Endonucleibacter bathymodioli TaxID=539814 RepID=A0AA90NKY9_9GAMM|nr:hypothetical protein [Candidatus Endonucleobacter bathymodioli]
MRHIEKVEPEGTLTVRPKTNVRPLMNKRYTHLIQCVFSRYYLLRYLHLP